MDEKIMQEETNQDELQESVENASDNPSGTQAEVDTAEVETDNLKNQVNELKDKYLRLVADFDNFRKRSARERLELVQTASKEVMGSLLTVLDDTERAEKQLQKDQDIDHVKEGIGLVFNKLRNTLQVKGLKPMESVGQEFNPELHEAITEIPAPSPELAGKVLDEVEKGYYLNDKLIRHAKVVVGK